jgi:RNA polymerase primary sigma factor
MRVLKISTKLTNRESDSFKQYLKDIANIEMLTPEEEIELTNRTVLGDEEAIMELSRRNLRFVVSVAKQYASANNPLQDLVNEGNIGLIKAARKFDPNSTQGKSGGKIKFISYAVWWVRKTIIEHLSKHGRLVRLPANKLNGLSKLDKKVNELEQREGRSIDIKEVIEEFGNDISASNLELLDVLNTYSMDSLDRQIGDEDGGTALGDLISGEGYDSTDHLVNTSDLKGSINRMLNTLSERDKYIMISLYGLDGSIPKTLAEVGVDVGVTREMIRQIKEKTLKKLQAKLVNSNLKEQY